VKVTQRVPVRIRLDDPAEVAALATGLSAEVTVQTGAPFLSADGRGVRSPCPTSRKRLPALACRRLARHRGQASRADHAVDHAGDDHAGARHHHRQRRPAVDGGRPRRLAGHDQLGADQLHRRRGDHDADDRLAVGPLRQARAVPVSIVGFVATSIACGMAWSLPSMVAFRLLQGVFGAAIVPLSQTFLLDINPREKAGQAMAMWGAGIMVGPIIGPTLGGWLTESYNWRWVFFINLPVGILAFLGCAAYPAALAAAPRSFDFRLRDAVAGHRRAATDARPRGRGGLVRLGRDLDLCRSGLVSGFWMFASIS
jgi:hypothetical protein